MLCPFTLMPLLSGTGTQFARYYEESIVAIALQIELFFLVRQDRKVLDGALDFDVTVGPSLFGQKKTAEREKPLGGLEFVATSRISARSRMP